MESGQIHKCYPSKEVRDILLQPVLRKLPNPEEGASNPQGVSAFHHQETPVPGGPATRGRSAHGIRSNHLIAKLTTLMGAPLPDSSFHLPDAKRWAQFTAPEEEEMLEGTCLRVHGRSPSFLRIIFTTDQTVLGGDSEC